MRCGRPQGIPARVRAGSGGGYGARQPAGTLAWWWDVRRIAERMGSPGDARSGLEELVGRVREASAAAAGAGSAPLEHPGFVRQLRPLYVAAERGDLWGVRTLLALGADVDGRDRTGATAAMVRARARARACARALRWRRGCRRRRCMGTWRSCRHSWQLGATRTRRTRTGTRSKRCACCPAAYAGPGPRWG